MWSYRIIFIYFNKLKRPIFGLIIVILLSLSVALTALITKTFTAPIHASYFVYTGIQIPPQLLTSTMYSLRLLNFSYYIKNNTNPNLWKINNDETTHLTPRVMRNFYYYFSLSSISSYSVVHLRSFFPLERQQVYITYRYFNRISTTQGGLSSKKYLHSAKNRDNHF